MHSYNKFRCTIDGSQWIPKVLPGPVPLSLTPAAVSGAPQGR